MGRLETLPALGRESMSNKILIPRNKPVPSHFSVPPAALRFGLYLQVLQSILTSVNQTPLGNVPGHRISNIYAAKAVGFSNNS